MYADYIHIVFLDTMTLHTEFVISELNILYVENYSYRKSYSQRAHSTAPCSLNTIWTSTQSVCFSNNTEGQNEQNSESNELLERMSNLNVK